MLALTKVRAGQMLVEALPASTGFFEKIGFGQNDDGTYKSHFSGVGILSMKSSELVQVLPALEGLSVR